MDGVADPSDQGSPTWIQAALAEYEAHRAEVVAEGATLQQILAFGAAAVGIAAAGAFNVWDERGLAAVAFLGVVPLLSLLVLIQWAGRTAAMMRVGVYLELIEGALREATSPPTPLLAWEERLAKARGGRFFRPQAEWANVATVSIFGAIALGSTAVGAERGWEDHRALALTVAVVELIVVLAISATIAYGIVHARAFARTDFGSATEGAESPRQAGGPGIGP
jgi:hypothetical protein